jgi:hypothetical protein
VTGGGYELDERPANGPAGQVSESRPEGNFGWTVSVYEPSTSVPGAYHVRAWAVCAPHSF